MLEGGTTEEEGLGGAEEGAEGAEGVEEELREEDEGGDKERARATATAWFAPFPPALRVRFVDESVWPGRTIDGTVPGHVLVVS